MMSTLLQPSSSQPTAPAGDTECGKLTGGCPSFGCFTYPLEPFCDSPVLFINAVAQGSYAVLEAVNTPVAAALPLLLLVSVGGYQASPGSLQCTQHG